MIGRKTGEVTPLEDEGLLAARGTEVSETVAISDETRTEDDETLLPKGFVLVKVTDDGDDDYGLYREFDESATNGQQNEETAVILGQDIDVEASNDGKRHAKVFVAGVFKREKVVEPEGSFDWSEVRQRLILRPDQE